MDPAVARERLLAERAEVLSLLHLTDEDTEEAQESEQETGDIEDAAQPLTAEGTDGAIADTLQDRLAQIDRALKRLDEGTWGVSVRSGTPRSSLPGSPSGVGLKSVLRTRSTRACVFHGWPM